MRRTRGGVDRCGRRRRGVAAPGAVVVTKAENVGPYATVQLHSTDSSALDSWLAQNGFNIPADVVPVINQYVAEGFDFLAMKLLPNQGVQSMRPVRVTTPGGSLSLPLRMASVGTGATVGITIWVVSDGRYEPQNFPFFHIEDSALVWDFKASLSNYTTLRAQQEAALSGKGWEIESSLTLNQQLITNVILSGGQYYGARGGGGFGPNIAPADPALDYLPVGSADAGADAEYQSADAGARRRHRGALRGHPGSNVRVTRMRSDISHAAMTKDFVLQASADQSELSNVRNVTQSVNLVCPVYPAWGAARPPESARRRVERSVHGRRIERSVHGRRIERSVHGRRNRAERPRSADRAARPPAARAARSSRRAATARPPAGTATAGTGAAGARLRRSRG